MNIYIELLSANVIMNVIILHATLCCRILALNLGLTARYGGAIQGGALKEVGGVV